MSSLQKYTMSQKKSSIIKRFILLGTTILSDCWKAYSSLSSEGYLHETVHHSIQFKSESGTHTNNIESRWNALKKSLPRYGTRTEFYNSYFAEYCVRRKFLNTAPDRFLEALHLIGLVYRPPDTHSAETTASVDTQPQELLAANIPSPPTTFASFDVANFDLQFDISDDEQDIDTSADMFL